MFCEQLNSTTKFSTRIYGGFKIWLITLFCGWSSLFASAEEYQDIRAIIFDCDGVLVDTEYLKFLSWQEALSSQNIDFSLEEYMPLVGHSSKNILRMIEQAKRLELSDEIIELKNVKYKTLQNQGVPPIQPMINFVRHLSENKKELGMKLCLASSAPKEEILVNLEQIGLENVFDLVISGSDDLDDYIDLEGTNKPKPYIYIEISKRLNLSPELCLVFEDTTAGVDAAADAGMIAIAVPHQFTLNQNFSKASYILFSHEELSSIPLFNRKKHSMHYTIVLTPAVDQAMSYIEASQLLYKDCEPSYLLTNDGTSSPHITVVQFDCESVDLAYDVWFALCEKMREENFRPFSPPFTGVSFVEGVGPYKDTTWVELSIKRGNEQSSIMSLHHAALEALKYFNLEPLNAIGSNYRPHLTLARIIIPEQIKAWPKTLYENSGNFKLEFGLSDEKWQYAQTLETFP